MSGGKPIVLIIHAQTKPPLVELDEEAANLQEALRKGGGCEPRILLAANSERIFAELNDCGDEIIAIHYAGHANGTGVMLPLSGEGSESAGRLSHIEGLAGRLKQLKNLRFVFLNGCATKDQVTDIIEAEIPAVIATLRGIDDRVARDFATEFYRSFASNHSIDEAFQSAENRIKEHKGGSRRGPTRRPPRSMTIPQTTGRGNSTAREMPSSGRSVTRLPQRSKMISRSQARASIRSRHSYSRSQR